MSIKTKVIKKVASRYAKKTIKSGKELAEDVMDNARPKLKALKKAAVKQSKAIRKAAAPKVKQLKKAAAPRVKAIKKAAGKAADRIKEEARGMTKDALMAGSKRLKKAAKSV